MLRLALAGAATATVLLAQPFPAGANGGTLRLSRVTAGPYHVSAWTQPQPPRVGRLDLSVALMFPESGQAVPDGEVRAIILRAEGPETRIRRTLGRGAGGNVLLYHAVLDVPLPGRWRVTIEAGGPLGGGQTAFDLDVLPPLPFARLALSALAVATLVAVGWWIRTRLTSKRGAAPIVCLALVALPAAATAQTFDPSRYQPSTLEAIVGQYPGRPGIVVNPDLPFRVKATYTGRFRGLAQDTRRLIEAWSAAMAGPDVAGAFRRELDVEGRGQRYWLAVQEVLVPLMEGELRAGESIELFVIYIGQIDGHHVLLINAFDHDHRNDPRR